MPSELLSIPIIGQILLYFDKFLTLLTTIGDFFVAPFSVAFSKILNFNLIYEFFNTGVNPPFINDTVIGDWISNPNIGFTLADIVSLVDKFGTLFGLPEQFASSAPVYIWLIVVLCTFGVIVSLVKMLWDLLPVA